MKLNLLINKEINTIISDLAKNMGTSKRNVISLALSSILEKDITKDHLEGLKDRIHLTYETTVTVNEEFNQKLNAVHRFGLAKWKFYGYLVCDYFYKNSEKPLNDTIENEHTYATVYLDGEQKENIQQIAEAKSMTVNSLFINYIINGDMEVKLPQQEKLILGMTENVKNELEKKAKKQNVSVQFYLEQIAAKIEEDFKM